MVGKYSYNLGNFETRARSSNNCNLAKCFRYSLCVCYKQFNFSINITFIKFEKYQIKFCIYYGLFHKGNYNRN